LLRLEDNHLHGGGGEPSIGIEDDAFFASEPVVPLTALDPKDREADGYASRQVVPLRWQGIEQC
jgi:hypothetical protein